MSDNANDKKIEEAAEQYHPVYDDKAWEKMEHLLDQHLPLKKKKRRLIFFLLPLILAGAVILFFIIENGRKGHTPNPETTISSAKSVEQNPAPLTSNSSDSIDKKLSSENIEANQPIAERKIGVLQKTYPDLRKNSNRVTGTTLSIPKKVHGNDLKNIKNNSTAKDEIEAKQGNADNSNSIVESNVIVEPLTSSSVVVKQEEENNKIVESLTSSSIINQKEKDQNDDPLNETAVDKSDNSTEIKKEEITHLKTKNETKKRGNNFIERFGISISVGPDLSGSRLNNPGKIATNLGLGLSYSISPSFTLRSGFYTAKKIYSVGPLDYKSSAGPGNYYYLDNVDANCLVYSIPVNIDYNFKRVKNHNWILSTGLSSYIMKRETYEYHYKYPSGQTSTKDWIINNENKNIFSVLNLSGGYQYFFNNRISFVAEPYINIPFSGVGEGKVKLKSTGILFSLSVKPFLKK